MKKTNLVKELGSKVYLRYSRANVLNFLQYARSVEFDPDSIVESKDFRLANKMLRSKLPSFYAARHSKFKSLADFFGGRPVVDLASSVSAARRDFSVKPASWFSVEDAYLLIEEMKKMGATSILDPFHGWGARYIASAMSGVDYIGIDANQLLHEELLALCPGATLFCADSFTFDFSSLDVDAVFTCPPYWRCEDYGYRVKTWSYSKFVSNLADLFERLSLKVKVQFVSIEDFTLDRKYGFEKDFCDAIQARGILVEEVSYKSMKRSFGGDKSLKVFILRR